MRITLRRSVLKDKVYYNYSFIYSMNTNTDEHDVQKETLGEINETLATTNFSEEVLNILPSTDVKEILPIVEPEVKEEV